MENNKDTASYKNLTEEYQDLYDFLISNGVSRLTALDKLKEFKDQEDNRALADSKIRIRMQFPEELLNQYGWASMSSAEKDKGLWALGMDSKKPWYTSYQRVREGTKVVFKSIVWGTERLDKEWLTKRHSDFTYYASSEARDAERNRKDPEYAREISKLSM